MRLTAVIAIGFLLLGTAVAPSYASTISFNDFTLFQAATSSLTEVNFDLDPSNNVLVDNTQLASIYASVGVVFPDGNRVEAEFTDPHSAPNGWINDVPKFFDATFPGGFTAVGVFNVFFGDQHTLTAFDSGHNVLGVVSSDAVLATKDFFGLTSTTPIASITVLAPGANGWGLDDLNVGSAAVTTVPEPGSLALLGIALAAFGIIRRRKKA